MSALATAVFRGLRPIPALPADDRGLAYGDGLFETLRVHGRRAVWWDAHVQRLASGAARLGIAAPAPAWLAAEAAKLLAVAPADAVLKIVLTRGAGGRGYSPLGASEPTLVLSLHPPPPPAPGPLVLRWCDTPVSVQPALAGLKHLNRLEQVLARGEWSDPAIHEGLMLDLDGRVACATAANVFARFDGRWCTPRVERRGVAGIARAWVLANGDGAIEADFDRAQLEAADAVFLCNAVRGILPAGKLGDRCWDPHPALEHLRRTLGRAEPAFATGS